MTTNSKLAGSTPRPELQRLMAIIFEVSTETISTDLQIGDIAQWDSLGHAKLMLAVEEEFEISISSDEMADVQSVVDLEKLLTRKLR